MIMIWGSYLSLLDRMFAPLFFTMFIAQSAGGCERADSFHLCCWYCRCWNIIPKDVVLLVLGLLLFYIFLRRHEQCCGFVYAGWIGFSLAGRCRVYILFLSHR